MSDQRELIVNVSYRCPKCFCNFYIKEQVPSDKDIDGYLRSSESSRLCDFCEKNRPNNFQLLHRQLDVLEKASPSDFPAFIKNLVKHIDLKQRDE